MEEGMVVSTAKDDKAESVYEMYYNYEEPVKKAAGHRILALNRGESEKVLTVKEAASIAAPSFSQIPKLRRLPPFPSVRCGFPFQ